ncbi:MAG: ParA family protein, partial [Acetobacteraceae bacterium]|nr:ParA family protein [Acetobacteraceae bacterium]
MRTIVLASQKGGAGKTTLAAHVAVAAEAAGAGPTVLIDTDPQGSLSAWWNVREADTPALAPSTIPELPDKRFCQLSRQLGPGLVAGSATGRLRVG